MNHDFGTSLGGYVLTVNMPLTSSKGDEDLRVEVE